MAAASTAWRERRSVPTRLVSRLIRLAVRRSLVRGYGTGTSRPTNQPLADDLRALSIVFSPRDIAGSPEQGPVRSTVKQDQIGTLEPGKLADLVLIDGIRSQTSTTCWRP